MNAYLVNLINPVNICVFTCIRIIIELLVCVEYFSQIVTDINNYDYIRFQLVIYISIVFFTLIAMKSLFHPKIICAIVFFLLYYYLYSMISGFYLSFQ